MSSNGDGYAHAGKPARRWLHVGHSSDGNAHRAEAEAARGALGHADPRLLIAFSWDGYDLPALLDGIAREAGDTPVLGCSTAGEISGGGPGDAAVVVTAIGGPGFEVRTAAASAAASSLREASTLAAECMTELPASPHRLLLML